MNVNRYHTSHDKQGVSDSGILIKIKDYKDIKKSLYSLKNML